MTDDVTAAEFAAMMKVFVRERDEALLSMDEQKIRAYGDKWGVDWSRLPPNSETFWASVHMARTGAKSLPLVERIKSKAWLHQHKLPSLDDDLPVLSL